MIPTKQPTERSGPCAAVGSWSPGTGRRRVPWRCKCEGYHNSVTLTAQPWLPTCTCGHSRAVHAPIVVEP